MARLIVSIFIVGVIAACYGSVAAGDPNALISAKPSI